MSALRDRRVRIYRYANVGVGGLVSAKYTFFGEYWAAINQRSAIEVAAAGAGAENINAAIDFARGIDVRGGDLLIDAADDTRFFARGITTHRNPDACLVTAERIKREVYESLNSDLTGTPVDATTSDAYDTSVVES